jgi:hypothetical protein
MRDRDLVARGGEGTRNRKPDTAVASRDKY